MYRCAHKLNIDHISYACVYAFLILLPLYIYTVRIYIYIRKSCGLCVQYPKTKIIKQNLIKHQEGKIP